MAYNRKNHLIKVLDVQSLVLQYQKEHTQRWIHKNIIYPKYPMTMVTYYNYLKTNARKELKELTLKENEAN